MLMTFFMDDDTYYYCDDVQDVTDGVTTWLAASALADCSDIKSGSGLSSEPLTITIDGTRVFQASAGFIDPNELFRNILTLKLHNRRFQLDYGISALENDSGEVTLVLPGYSGLINNAKITMPSMDFGELVETDQRPEPVLEITIDSITARYSWLTGRTRSDADQQEISTGDTFFKFVNATVQNERKLYWGKKQPNQVNH